MSFHPAWTSMREMFTNILLKMPLSSNIAELRDRIVAADAQEAVSPFLDEIQFRVEICLETQCKEEQYYYYLLRSYCNLWFNQVDDATNAAIYATKGFRMCAVSWAEIFGHWFLGAIYAMEKRGYLYLAEVDHALEILEAIRQQHLINGEYDQASYCRDLISQLEENKSIAAKMGTGPLHMPGKAMPPPPPPPAAPDSGRILLPWIPKFQKVRAGAGGTAIWVQSLPEYSFASIVEIDNKPHRIHSLRGTAPSDHNVTLVNGERYGWALVEGHSMNMCHPATIEDGDYILFREHKVPADHDIVVVARPVASGEFTHMVKRYRDHGKLLLSETDATGPEYSPVKLGLEHQILGVVLAVAKSET